METSQSLDWKHHLGPEKKKPYFQELINFVEEERRSGKVIYPPNNQVFNALQTTPLSSVKVVILGQDPYHGPRQAHGLCFSVQEGTEPPPSLKNIFKELSDDLHLPMPNSGDLTPWAQQGVLLLNTVLTVRAGNAASHAGKGWERFTDKVIVIVNEYCPSVVFLLWGAHAQKKGEFIHSDRHYILKAPHPSPLSAHRGFLGCKHFSKANAYLENCGVAPVDWNLTR